MYQVIYTDFAQCRFNKDYKTLKGAYKKFYELINQKAKEITIFHNVKGFHSTTQVEYIVRWYCREIYSYYTNLCKTDKELESKRFTSSILKL